MTFSKPQQKLEHRSNPAYQGAHGHAPEAEEALAWVLLETVIFPQFLLAHLADRVASTPPAPTWHQVMPTYHV